MQKPTHELKFSGNYDQPDGARWSVFDDAANADRYGILTSAGQELMRGGRAGEGLDYLRSLMRQYRASESGDNELFGDDPNMRRELGRGQEAVVYGMGPFAVREEAGIKNFYTALGELTRMDAINHVVEHGVPRWLNLPTHYGLYADPKRFKTYTLMKRINGGLTAEDIANYPDIPNAKKDAAENGLGGAIEEAKVEVPVLYNRAYDILVEGIEESGQKPSDFLTDWEPRNVIVTPLRTPVAGSNYSLHVIDQYRR